MTENDKKIVAVDLAAPLTADETAVLQQLTAEFSPDDILLSADVTLTACIRALDVTEFAAAVDRLGNEHSLPEDNPFAVLAEKIAAVGSYGIKGSKRIFVGFNKERKVKNREAKEKKRGVYFYAQQNDFSPDNRLLPEKFCNAIVCGDSEQILKELPDNCIDLVFTSPPYNFGLDYQANEDDNHWENYFAKLFAVLDECIRVLKYGGRLIVNIQPLFSDYIPSHHIISHHLMQRKLIWKGEVVWEKNNYNCKYTAWGSWKSPSNPYLKYTWEFVEIFCKGVMKKTGQADRIDISADEFKKWVVAKWSIAPERNMRTYGHPAMFPEELAARVMKLFSYQEDVILDPFNGVGTTTAVAARLGRRYLGIDIAPEYCQTARQRTQASGRSLSADPEESGPASAGHDKTQRRKRKEE